MSEDYKVVPIDTIKQHPQNPRVGVVPAIKEAIAKNGWHGALVVQKSTAYILAGNHRWLAAKELGLRNLPVHIVDVDDAAALRILLADNRTADLATYDDPKLQEVLMLVLQEEPTDKAAALSGTGYTPEAQEQLALALGGGEAKEWGALGSNEEARDRYDATVIRQIVWVMDVETYERVMPVLVSTLEKQGLDTISQVLLWVVDRYAATLKEPTPA